MWENNLLKFYLEYHIDQAIEYGHGLIDNLGEMLPEPQKQDLNFSVATAHSLKCDDLEMAMKLYNKTFYLEEPEMIEKYPQLQDIRGIAYNNLGISHFYKFIEISNGVADPS